jgi:small subunit ribosomal protein S10
MTEQKVRIKIKSFDYRLADQAVRQIIDAVERTGAIVVGPVPLPTRIEKFCVIRSSNIDKDSREQFELRTHKRLIDVLQPSSKTIDALSQLDLASGVEIDIKL